jgi:hypothetical protein
MRIALNICASLMLVPNLYIQADTSLIPSDESSLDHGRLDRR